MYAPNQTVHDTINNTPSYAYRVRKQTHYLWTRKAIKEYPKIRHQFTFSHKNLDGTFTKSKPQYSLFKSIATPKHITEAKLLLKKGYIIPATQMSKREKDYVISYETRNRIIYDLKQSLQTKWTVKKYKHRIRRFFYAFVLRKQHPSFF